MRFFWRLFGLSVFQLPKGVRLIQAKALCNQLAVSEAVELTQFDESFCPTKNISIIVMPNSFEGTYGNELGAEVKRYRARWFRSARCILKIRSADISASILSMLLNEVNRG